MEIRGNGPPLVFTTPGWGASIHGYRHLQPLEERFTVVWVETRGTGSSTAPADGDYRLPRFTEDLEALRRTGCRPLVGRGTLDGRCARPALRRAPSRPLPGPAAVVHLSAARTRPSRRHHRPRCRRRRARLRRGPRRVPGAGDDGRGGHHEARCHPSAVLLRSRRGRTVHGGVRGNVLPAAAMVAESPDHLDRSAVEILPTLDLPTVVVAATNDFVCSPPWNQQIHHLIPGSKFVLVERAGHFPWFENPAQFWSGLDHALSAM
ncbi:MAG: alpha/beta hydrolase [Acidimicrobiales bacterium]